MIPVIAHPCDLRKKGGGKTETKTGGAAAAGVDGDGVLCYDKGEGGLTMNRYPWLEELLCAMPGCTRDYKVEWGWQRYRVGGKLFAATCQPGPEHKGYDCRELISLKCEPERAELLRAEFPDIIPGFYLDKRNWNSVFLDGAVPEDVLRELCVRSYRLVFQKMTKKQQREILKNADLDVGSGR